MPLSFCPPHGRPAANGTIPARLTETSPVSMQTRADDSLERRVSTVGRVHPHVEIKIVDP